MSQCDWGRGGSYEGQLIVRRRLEDASIPLHVTLGDGDAAGGVTSHDPTHQLIVRRIEKTEFDRYAERSCGLPLLVALRASPETPFEHNGGSQHEEPLRKFPEFRFESGLEALVERINAQRRLPLIRVEPDCPVGLCKLDERASSCPMQAGRTATPASVAARCPPSSLALLTRGHCCRTRTSALTLSRLRHDRRSVGRRPIRPRRSAPIRSGPGFPGQRRRPGASRPVLPGDRPPSRAGSPSRGAGVWRPLDAHAGSGLPGAMFGYPITNV